MSELPKGVSVILYRDGYFAISRRLNTEGHKGLFQFAGGHVEPGELALHAAQRELVEETGLSLPLDRFVFLGTTEPLVGYSGDQYIGFRYGVILGPYEEPQRTEPLKATEWTWYPADAMRELKMLQQTQNYAFTFHAGLTALRSSLDAANRALAEARKDIAERIAVYIADRPDGNWLDPWGSCRVCGGEIPHGHLDNCDIFKKECEERVLLAQLTEVRANLEAAEKERDVANRNAEERLRMQIMANENFASAQADVARLTEQWHQATLGKSARGILDRWHFEYRGYMGDPSLGQLQALIELALSAAASREAALVEALRKTVSIAAAEESEAAPFGGEVNASCDKRDKDLSYWNGYWSAAHNIHHDSQEIVSAALARCSPPAAETEGRG